MRINRLVDEHTHQRYDEKETESLQNSLCGLQGKHHAKVTPTAFVK
ncbi:hypothetical protein O979_00135 [Mycobacterium avium subsp. paratuberculosis 10-4404]|nr:hypothetical protein O979_00135 [Mycobacterium avium subsp. paratuberculosis 10-4404]ETB08652.1 hypothetical protein O978_00185 [Mycobacterium avium subsp. paratuberculosis 10-5864]ETB15205.1 hypothetical protein O980_00215 [Mycobacterium avium subsp. paratuberculosis 08-8281]ETB37107.1 hypothetical protein O977_00205 [Mycobacterium avium subsp. paratuberculosis 10-5975]ETB45236.1 hypothetical protein O975_00225 [Mycobacterium avium subsp. paratuberculosis 11-1786]ETB55198.1 hypothetical pr